MRRYVPAAAIVLLPVATLFLLTLQGCTSRGAATPEATFARAKEFIREEKFDRLWGLMTEEYQRRVADSFREHQRLLREAGVNRKTYESMILQQYGLGPEEFLAKTPRELFEIVAARQREMSLKAEIVRRGPVTGDRATLFIRGAPEWPDTPWYYKRVDGKWLLDDVPMNPRGNH